MGRCRGWGGTVASARRAWAAALVGIGLGIVGATGATAATDAERRASCTGLAVTLPGTSSGQSGGRAPAGDAAARLPRRMHLDGGTQAISHTWDYALLDGALHARTRKRGARPAGGWERVVLPACIEGRLTSISNDHDLLIAVDDDRRVWWTYGSERGPSALDWARRWGPILWAGDGVHLPADTIAWSTSATNGDMRFVDGSGTLRHTAGAATLYQLRAGGQRITYDDPWLPSDASYEVCGPRNGRFRAVGLAAAGATIMVIGHHGEIYTRTFDFDLSGANTLLMRYSYADQRGVPGDVMQLPRAGWRRQPTIDRRLTSRIGVLVTGDDESQRLLRVEGVNRAGRRGVWQKQVDADRWRWVGTDEPLRGEILSDDRTPARLGDPDVRRYHATVGGVTIEAPDLSAACSPATLRLRAQGRTVDLRLHLVDAIRQAVRGPGIDATPRAYLGQIEVPADVLARRGDLPSALRAVIDGPLGGRRFTDAPTMVTDRVLRLGAQCWSLTPDGAPPSPRLLDELVAQLLEPGTIVNLVTGQQDHRAPLPVPTC
ncbi:MAG: hypothetical protein M0P31_17860 [Solirubrobacteraceae bacterium]|nr:hypothetical protein [Solirubrobacteraceae bacterium]